MDVIYLLDDTHSLQLHDLYQQEWWSQGRSLAETIKCVAGSQICIGLVDGDNDLVGFARVLTDYTFKAFIFDVIVRRNERGNGLGDKLISLVKTHKQLQDVQHFELYCLPDMVSFYASHGFTSDMGDVRLMRQTNTSLRASTSTNQRVHIPLD